MGQAHHPKKVKLIIGLIARDAGLFTKVKGALEKALRNKADFESGIIDFVHTDYYNAEMGTGLKRRFLSFGKLVGLEDIYSLKVKTNRIEKRFSKGGRRTVNIDPGYVDLSKVVLFSTKDFTHRIYLRKGIFAEVTLFYKGKTFNPWPWTYPDYRTDMYIGIFNKIRDMYKENIGAPTCS
jgi:hypothetical protein